jgi:hypothetical protein
MMRKVLIFSFAVAYLYLGGTSFANNSPADMVLQTEKDTAQKPKPAVLPHQKHQEIIGMMQCHDTVCSNYYLNYSSF